MKITRNNGFDEDSEFRHKLKQKMEAYTPEASGTLWDRISVSLDNHVEKKRRKGFALWIWAASLLLTALGSWYTFEHFTGDSSGTPVLSETQQAPATAAPVPPAAQPENQPTISAQEQPATIFAETDSYQATNRTRRNIPSSRQETAGTRTTTSSQTSAGQPTTSTGSEINTPQPSVNNIAGSQKTTEPAKAEAGTEKPAETTTPAIAETKKTEPQKPVQPEDKNKNVQGAKYKPGLLVGFTYLVAYNYRTAKDAMETVDLPTAKNKNDYEKGSWSFSNYGLVFGLQFSEHWYVSTGYQFNETREEVRFNQTRRKTALADIPPYGNAKDSVSVGSSMKYTSTWNTQSIPLQIGFLFKGKSRIGVNISAGINYHIMKKFEYRMLQVPFYNDFVPVSNSGRYAYDRLQFSNYVSAQGQAGVTYQVFDNCFVMLGAYGEKALQSYSKKESGIDTRPYRYGVQTGLIFSLK